MICPLVDPAVCKRRHQALYQWIQVDVNSARKEGAGQGIAQSFDLTLETIDRHG